MVVTRADILIEDLKILLMRASQIIFRHGNIFIEVT